MATNRRVAFMVPFMSDDRRASSRCPLRVGHERSRAHTPNPTRQDPTAHSCLRYLTRKRYRSGRTARPESSPAPASRTVPSSNMRRASWAVPCRTRPAGTRWAGIGPGRCSCRPRSDHAFHLEAHRAALRIVPARPVADAIVHRSIAVLVQAVTGIVDPVGVSLTAVSLQLAHPRRLAAGRTKASACTPASGHLLPTRICAQVRRRPPTHASLERSRGSDYKRD